MEGRGGQFRTIHDILVDLFLQKRCSTASSPAESHGYWSWGCPRGSSQGERNFFWNPKFPFHFSRWSQLRENRRPAMLWSRQPRWSSSLHTHCRSDEKYFTNNGKIFDKISAPISPDPQLNICRTQLHHHIPNAHDPAELGLKINKKSLFFH